MDKENRLFGKIKMYTVFQLNLVNGAMGLAELGDNSWGISTTFWLIIQLKLMLTWLMKTGLWTDEVERKSFEVYFPVNI